MPVSGARCNRYIRLFLAAAAYTSTNSEAVEKLAFPNAGKARIDGTRCDGTSSKDYCFSQQLHPSPGLEWSSPRATGALRHREVANSRKQSGLAKNSDGDIQIVNLRDISLQHTIWKWTNRASCKQSTPRGREICRPEGCGKRCLTSLHLTSNENLYR